MNFARYNKDITKIKMILNKTTRDSEGHVERLAASLIEQVPEHHLPEEERYLHKLVRQAVETRTGRYSLMFYVAIETLALVAKEYPPN